MIWRSILVLVGEDKLVSKDADNGKSRDDHTESTKREGWLSIDTHIRTYPISPATYDPDGFSSGSSPARIGSNLWLSTRDYDKEGTKNHLSSIQRPISSVLCSLTAASNSPIWYFSRISRASSEWPMSSKDSVASLPLYHTKISPHNDLEYL